jgi:hypothetical protein
MGKSFGSKKATRGQGWVIAVGPMFYAGWDPEIRIVEKTPDITGRHDQRQQRYRLRDYWTGSYTYGGSQSRSRVRKDTKNEKAAGYLKPQPRPSKIEVKEFTGKKTPRLVAEIPKAKEYRSEIQAKKACELLKTQYSDLNVTINVVKKGDHSEHS